VLNTSYDALIVGAGPAGCAAAFDLAMGGRRVLLLDRRTFPRPKACACGLTRKTLAALRYSVDPIVERRCSEIVLQRSGEHGDIADKSLELRVRSRKPIAAMAVRERFDDFCLQQTLAAGRNGGSVVLQKIDSLSALREFGDRVELEVLLQPQQTQTFTATVLIGADGSNGQTRRLEAALPTVQEPTKNEGFAEPAWFSRGFALEATVPYDLLASTLPQHDAPHDLVFDFAPLPGGYGWLFPKGDHINIGVGAFAEGDPAQLKAVTRALLAGYMRRKLCIEIAEDGATPADKRLRITGQHLGMGGHRYVPRGRVLLTGDAAGLVDPLTGEGIHSALISGQAAAAAVLSDAPNVAAAYAQKLAPLQQTLAFSARAAVAFYREPARGFRAMSNPLLQPLILKTYADGLPAARLLNALARFV
jgi:geranylgeranyl reductase family protein